MKSRFMSNPARLVILGFVMFIIIGTALLLLPFSHTGDISPVDAFFTATSAVCVTGLIVLDTPVDFTGFGQVVILLLIQIGGFGYMTSATIIALLVGKRIGLSERLAMKEELNIVSLEGVVRFAKTVLMATVIFEAVGAVLLTLRFAADLPFGQAAWYGLFHSVSAFNNAGFSLFSDNMIGYRNDPIVSLAITALVVIGGIGFVVIREMGVFTKRHRFRPSLHAKVVLWGTFSLIILGAAVVFAVESFNPATLEGASAGDKALTSLFASATPRTAGFNNLDYSQLAQPTMIMTLIFMFIGGAPGSTAGGIKITTFIIFVAGLVAILKGRRDTVLFHRRLPLEIVSKSVLILTLMALLIAGSFMVLLATETAADFAVLFETTSAAGTVGLSTGDGGARSLSALFTPAGKLIICFVMFAGRLGPLTLTYALVRRKKELYRYPEGKVIIG